MKISPIYIENPSTPYSRPVTHNTAIAFPASSGKAAVRALPGQPPRPVLPLHIAPVYLSSASNDASRSSPSYNAIHAQ